MARRHVHSKHSRNITKSKHTIDSPSLLSKFPLDAPTQLLRNKSVIHVPYARVNTVKNGLFSRIPKISAFLAASGDVDVWPHSQLEHKHREAASAQTR